MGLAFISIVWSEVPFATLKNSVALLGTTAFGIYLAARYTHRELMQLLLLAFGFIAVTSLGFVLFLPSLGLEYKTNFMIWRGVFDNKNVLGAVISLVAIAWLLYLIDSIKACKNIKAIVIGFVFYFICIHLIFSNSMTSLVAFSIALIILLFYLVWLHFKSTGLVILIILGVCGFAFWVVNYQDNLFAILGRTSTLTGRTPLWQAVWEMILNRPWLGYGYISYWLGLEGPFSGIMYKLYWDPGAHIVYWCPPHAHNGYLDLWLQLGLTGVVFYALSLFNNLYKAFNLVREKSHLINMFPLLFLVFMSIHNLGESTILFRNWIFWVLYTAFSIQLSHKTPKPQY